MLLYNEQHQQLNIRYVKAALTNLDAIKTPSRREAELAMENYYRQALEIENSKYRPNAGFAMAATSAATAGTTSFIGILDEIKKIICNVSANSTTDEIVDAILSAIAGLMPGGIFISALAKILVKYILSLGITNFCAA